MKMFVLQNRDFVEMYWSTDYGWADINQADCFFGTELDDTHCLSLLEKTKGRWVMHDVQFKVESLPF